MTTGPTIKDYEGLDRSRETLVGIDSDGCLFDSMVVKQRDCFHGLIISFWGLESDEATLRECAEFLNLRSKWRGRNRFVTLLKLFQELPGHPEFTGNPPAHEALEAWLNDCDNLSNSGLEERLSTHPSPELQRVMDWSLAVNHKVATELGCAPLFDEAREALEIIAATSAAICVSQTPREALIREWHEKGIENLVQLIGGQEQGPKSRQMRQAAGEVYEGHKTLLIGDAPGDLEGAREAGCLFYPINPGEEVASWKAFREEGYPRFLSGDFAGAYEQKLEALFLDRLPEALPWATDAQ